LQAFRTLLAALPLIGVAKAQRPPITGVSHIALWVRDLEKSRAFYEAYLGFEEPFSLKNAAGDGIRVAWVKINDRQTVELYPTGGQAPADGINLRHIALETTDVSAMLAYLKTKGAKALGGGDLPDAPHRTTIGDLVFTVQDPDGHGIEFVTYGADGWIMKNKGRSLGATRISNQIGHCGVEARDMEASLRFYRDVLGLVETKRVTRAGNLYESVSFRVPEGENHVEFTLFRKPLTLEELHILQHFCLDVPDLPAALETLGRRTPPPGSKGPSAMRTGYGKRVVNLFDPDGTRVEIMDDAPPETSTPKAAQP
jgi:lactoylglutathione lyase